MWFVYLLECADNTLYAGVTKDLERRVDEHNDDDKKGAKYTRNRRPVSLVYSESFDEKNAAYRREWEFKQMTRKQKLALLDAQL